MCFVYGINPQRRGRGTCGTRTEASDFDLIRDRRKNDKIWLSFPTRIRGSEFCLPCIRPSKSNSSRPEEPTPRRSIVAVHCSGILLRYIVAVPRYQYPLQGAGNREPLCRQAEERNLITNTLCNKLAASPFTSGRPYRISSVVSLT